MLQKVSSVFVVYRRKTLTGSPDPTHATVRINLARSEVLHSGVHCVQVTMPTSEGIYTGCETPGRCHQKSKNGAAKGFTVVDPIFPMGDANQWVITDRKGR